MDKKTIWKWIGICVAVFTAICAVQSLLALRLALKEKEEKEKAAADAAESDADESAPEEDKAPSKQTHWS